MPKRKGEHSLTSTVEKKAKKGEDPCGKFLSLAAADDTLLAGLNLLKLTIRLTAARTLSLVSILDTLGPCRGCLGTRLPFLVL